MADIRLDQLKQSTNDLLKEGAIRHSIFLEGFKTGAQNRQLAFLNREVYPDLLRQMDKSLSRMGSSGSTIGTVRYNQMLRETDEIIRSGFLTARKRLEVRDLLPLGQKEGDIAVAQMQKATPIQLKLNGIDKTTINSIVKARPMQGKLLREWYGGLSSSTQSAVKSQINIGLAQGESVNKIVNRVRGTKANNFTDGVLQASRRNTTAIVRTSVAHTSNHAREESYKANSDVIKGVQYVATLDGRTTDICISLDGKVFPIGEGERPPQHMQCRSTTTPVMKSFKELGLNIKEPPKGTRATMNGQVPAGTTYSQWLKKQSTAFQNDVLGSTRAKLFRKGVPVTKFVDNRGRSLTLNELKRSSISGKFPKRERLSQQRFEASLVGLTDAQKKARRSAQSQASRARKKARDAAAAGGGTTTAPTPPAAPPPPPPGISAVEAAQDARIRARIRAEQLTAAENAENVVRANNRGLTSSAANAERSAAAKATAKARILADEAVELANKTAKAAGLPPPDLSTSTGPRARAAAAAAEKERKRLKANAASAKSRAKKKAAEAERLSSGATAVNKGLKSPVTQPQVGNFAQQLAAADTAKEIERLLNERWPILDRTGPGGGGLSLDDIFRAQGITRSGGRVPKPITKRFTGFARRSTAEAREIANYFVELAEEYGDELFTGSVQQVQMKSIRARTVADYAPRARVMRINTKQLGANRAAVEASAKYARERAVRTGQQPWVFDDNLRSVIHHEFGHAIDFNVEMSQVGQWLNRNRPKPSDMSRYGMTNVRENFAEATSALMSRPRTEWTKWMKDFGTQLATSLQTNGFNVPRQFRHLLP